jgi:hypothetical protein
MQQATLAIRAIPLEVLSDTSQPFPSFSGVYDAALKALRMEIADMPRPVRPMEFMPSGLISNCMPRFLLIGGRRVASPRTPIKRRNDCFEGVRELVLS